MDHFLYRGAKTREISFPLGGIGTGCIGLAGNGRLIDWEIFNRPNKGSTNGFTHFAIRAEAGDEVVEARVLNGDLQPPYSGELGKPTWSSFGWGPARDYLTGLPHFRQVEFRGEYPIAALRFVEPKFPGRVQLQAFNPFIPLDDKNSGIPAAFFEFEVENTTRRTLRYTLCGTLKNPLPKNNLHQVQRAGGLSLLHLRSDAFGGEELEAGDLCLATDAAQTSCQRYWYRGAWFDSLEVFWRDFTRPGRLKGRDYAADQAGEGNHASLAAHLELGPGERGRVRFILSWNFPNCQNYWNPKAGDCAAECGVSTTWKNYYATCFADARASARYGLKNWDSLYAKTAEFKEALFGSDLPPAALDAVSANLSILKSPTVMRLEDGTFYGWEGCHANTGCCEGSCTHVWNYAQALAFLFPQLERSMREADYHHNLREDGGMPFRLQLPLGVEASKFRPCADGQFGGVLKVYRDWKISGDSQWLRSLWPQVRRSLEFAWSPANEDQWDPQQTGVLQGRQHHTLDMELFGPNAWLTGFYLGALKAGAEMAAFLDEEEQARHYLELFTRGKAWTDEHLFNGEYYQQQLDLGDRGAAARFGAEEAYWSAEHGQLKYQVGEGCGLDQVLAQWHANLYGLGEIFDPGQTRKALRSLFRYNFKQPMRDHYNPCRIYSLNDEGGLVICAWPAGRPKPMIPLTYAQETMNGFEYAAAIQMIQSGLVKEGTKAVVAIRHRYDGERRNPWNEFECGSNYARSLASYALLNAFSGLSFDLVQGRLGFDPVQLVQGRFRCFWSLGTGWGMLKVGPGRAGVEVRQGKLSLRVLELPFLRGRSVRRVNLGGQEVDFVQEGNCLNLKRPAKVSAGHALEVQFKK
ncbi:MAG: hypothetical protein EXS58_15420 [Candidatus Latescibacteria bacterium]|nr:hypothetical protein [Candidatus Latescibacterota bacterium]